VPTDTEQAQDHSSRLALSSPPLYTVFFVKEYPAIDVTQACRWTYGYNADIDGDLFLG
jgi:hypothetical protein